MSENFYDESEKLKEVIASNLVKYRKAMNLTQIELSEKVNYSDKNISRWERGESVPEVTVLKRLADLYGVSVNDFLIEKSEVDVNANQGIKKKTKLFNKKQTIIILLSVMIVWLVAILVYCAFHSFVPNLKNEAWKVFLLALPVSTIVVLVFTSIWCTNLMNAIVVTVLIWTMAIAIYFCVQFESNWLIFIVAIPVQFMDILWFTLRKIKSNGKKGLKKSNEKNTKQ